MALIVKEICKSVGAGEITEVELIANTETGETKIAIRKTISEYHPITEYDDVMKLYDRLTGGNGRRVWALKDLT